MPFVAGDIILDAATVKQVTNVSHKTGNEHRKSMISGGAAVSQVSGQRAEEVTTFTSADLATLVALNTNTFCSAGLYLSSATITVPWKNRTNGGQFASGTNHSALSGAAALVIPTSFEASQDSDFATAQCEIHWLSSDGTTAGATGSTGNALGSQSFGAEFALGPVYFNASELAGIQSVKINPGITLVKSAAKGLIRPTKISIQTIEPTIEITTHEIDATAALLNAFTAMTSANIYFRRRADASVYTASDATNHLRFTFAAGLGDASAVEVSDNNNGTATFVMHGKTLTASAAVDLP